MFKKKWKVDGSSLMNCMCTKIHCCYGETCATLKNHLFAKELK